LRIATFAIGATRTARHIIAAYRTQSYRKKTVFDVFAELAAANSTRESTQVLCDFPSFYQLAALSSCSISFQHHDREYRSTSIFTKSNFTPLRQAAGIRSKCAASLANRRINHGLNSKGHIFQGSVAEFPDPASLGPA
jgi:hypothetical protein